MADELTHEQALRLAHLFVKRWFELTLAELNADIARLNGLDAFEQAYLRAMWTRAMDLLVSVAERLQSYDSEEGKLAAVRELFGAQLGLPPVAADVNQRLDWYKRRLSNLFEKSIKASISNNDIDSPIEQIFLMEWQFMNTSDRHAVRLEPQKVVKTPDGEFRVDFVVESDRDGIKLAVEIDGHDFHEKSKEQVARDNARDRALQREGYTVVRFSGSEVFRNPRKCIGEVESLISQRTG